MNVPKDGLRDDRKTALVLSGGGLRGAAHIGVIRALEESGFVPDMVVGASIGALVATAYALGMSSGEMLEHLEKVRSPNVTQLSLQLKLSLLRTTPMEDFLQEHVEPRTFADLRMPLGIVASDVLTGDRVLFTEGPVARAIRASSAIPGLFPPVEHEGRILVDGGVVDNLPADAAREMGADYVIAVDVLPPPEGKRRPKNPIDMIMLVSNIRCRLTHPDPSAIDCLVTPDLADLPFATMGEVEETERRGWTAMREKLDRVLDDLGRRRPA